MTYLEFTKIAAKKLNRLNTSELMEEAKNLMNNSSNEADMVLSVLLDILETRITKNDFLNFCYTL